VSLKVGRLGIRSGDEEIEVWSEESIEIAVVGRRAVPVSQAWRPKRPTSMRFDDSKWPASVRSAPTPRPL